MIVYGVVSFGFGHNARDCLPGNLALYADVLAERDWILDGIASAVPTNNITDSAVPTPNVTDSAVVAPNTANGTQSHDENGTDPLSAFMDKISSEGHEALAIAGGLLAFVCLIFGLVFAWHCRKWCKAEAKYDEVEADDQQEIEASSEHLEEPSEKVDQQAGSPINKGEEKPSDNESDPLVVEGVVHQL